MRQLGRQQSRWGIAFFIPIAVAFCITLNIQHVLQASINSIVDYDFSVSPPQQEVVATPTGDGNSQYDMHKATANQPNGDDVQQSDKYNLRPSDFIPLDNVDTNYLYADAEGSARTLLRAAQTPKSIPDDVIDPVIEEERCKRYNLNYSGRQTRRRIFYGSNIADDSWHIISTHAMEFYGIFDSVVFVESNRIQHHYPRTVRFGENSESLRLLQNHMYGLNTTRVHVDQYVNEIGWPKDLGWEGMQSGLILKRWKANGMTHDDIGYLSDVDEIYTRDYIRAMQICDVPQFDNHSNCKDARIAGHALVFEGGPRCAVNRYWWHPDLIIGACVEGVNNESHLHATAERGWQGTGWLNDVPESHHQEL